MLNLKYTDYNGKYYGFNLKKGHFYGEDIVTHQKIAATGWECDGNVAVYYLEESKWVLHWIDPIYISEIENLPDFETGKLSFSEWLKKEKGISWEEYNNEPDLDLVEEIDQEYDCYFYDGLPEFIINFLNEK